MALLGANKRKWSVCKRAGTREVTQKHSKLMPKVILALFIMMPVRASHNTSQAHFVELCLTYVLAFFSRSRTLLLLLLRAVVMRSPGIQTFKYLNIIIKSQ